MSALQKQDKALRTIKNLIDSAEKNLKLAKFSLSKILGNEIPLENDAQDFYKSDNLNVIEGVFNGENMEADDKKIYPVPANYASKSKLVAGDRLKLTIMPDGSFIFKQIGPINRKMLVGELKKDDDQFYVFANDQNYKVLGASITYFKGKVGDRISVIVPESKKSTWAAVEAVL
jgi:hypothetical protein